MDYIQICKSDKHLNVHKHHSVQCKTVKYQNEKNTHKHISGARFLKDYLIHTFIKLITVLAFSAEFVAIICNSESTVETEPCVYDFYIEKCPTGCCSLDIMQNL